MTSLLQLVITGLGAFIVSLIPLAALFAAPASKEACSSANIFEATRCVSAEAYAGVTYLAFIALSLIYAEIKRKGIDSSASSIGILLHDYAFSKNYSQRVHAVRYAFTQAIFAGIFVANLGYPFVIPATDSLMAAWEVNGATLIWSSGIGNAIVNYWWIIPFANIPLYWLMSMNRISAEVFISQIQLTQRRIDYYSNHSEEVTVAVKDSSALLLASGIEDPEKASLDMITEGKAKAVQDAEVSEPQANTARKWHQTPLFGSIVAALFGTSMANMIIIPKTLSIGLIFTTLVTVCIYIIAILASLFLLDEATSEGKRAGFFILGFIGYGAVTTNMEYVYGLWGIDYFLRVSMSVIVLMIPLGYYGLRRAGIFPLSQNSSSDK